MHTTMYIRDALGKALLSVALVRSGVCEHNMLYANVERANLSQATLSIATHVASRIIP